MHTSHHRTFRRTTSVSTLAVLMLVLLAAMWDAAAARAALGKGTVLTVVVIEKGQGTPLEYARVAVRRGSATVAGKITDASGRAVFKDLPAGRYAIVVHLVSHLASTDTITLTAASGAVIDTVLLAESVEEVTVSGSPEGPISTVDLRTGSQSYTPQSAHAAPQARMTEVIATNVVGAVRAPTGEVHVRGQHGEFTYIVDGVPIPMNVFGGLNEVVDPQVIDHATFLTGGFPAEYGGQMAAIMDIRNHVPAGKLHVTAETYAGSYATSGLTDASGQSVRGVTSNGQTLSMSDHVGDLGFFLSGTRQETARRIDPPSESLFHDHGFDYFLYGKADYLLGASDYLTMNLSWSRTATEVPFVASAGASDDHQQATNAFGTLTYYRSLSSVVDHESDLVAAIYVRSGGLLFTPGAIDPAGFFFAGDTNGYLLHEDRSFTTSGLRLKAEKRYSHEVQVAAGVEASSTSAHELFTPTAAVGSLATRAPVVADVAGADLGAFVQTAWHPMEWTSVEAGLRYDRHQAPDAPVATQLSPRLKWAVTIDEADNAYLYYGRLFMPTSIEGIRSIASAGSSTVTAQATAPERDHFYEAVLDRTWEFGLVSKLAGYYKHASPGLDDQTLGSSAIKTPVNILDVTVTGLELALSYAEPNGPLSCFANGAISHAMGSGGVTGGFLAADTAQGAFDLDHDQRLSLSMGGTWQTTTDFVRLSASYGSGLTNGTPLEHYATGLFAMDQAAHVTPAWIFDLSMGHTFILDREHTIEPSLYVTNLLDHRHMLKGSYFSAASWEEPRNVLLRIKMRL